MHTEIFLLASGYMELGCWDMWMPAELRHWAVRRTVNYSDIAQ